MSVLTLGGVVFQNFEVPSKIGFGGRQKLAIHKLIGGGRVIDTLGRDDMSLSWRGVLTGAGASDRSRMLNTMRVSGLFQNLSWNTYSYQVIISDLEFQYCNAWWISYRISCAVVQDLAQADLAYTPSATATVVNDLLAAASFVDPQVSSVLGSLASGSLSTPGSRGAALVSLGLVQGNVINANVVAEDGLSSDDLGQVIRATGVVANSAYAQGFLGRALANIGLLGGVGE